MSRKDTTFYLFVGVAIIVTYTFAFFVTQYASEVSEQRKATFDNTHGVIQQVEMEYYGNYIPLQEI